MRFKNLRNVSSEHDTVEWCQYSWLINHSYWQLHIHCSQRLLVTIYIYLRPRLSPISSQVSGSIESTSMPASTNLKIWTRAHGWQMTRSASSPDNANFGAYELLVGCYCTYDMCKLQISWDHQPETQLPWHHSKKNHASLHGITIREISTQILNHLLAVRWEFLQLIMPLVDVVV